MYKNFYHLSTRPFDHTPDPMFLYLSKGHREVLASMVYGINYAKGFILVAGDAGTGKTTLIQALLKELGPKFVVTHINNPRAGFGEIFYRLSKTMGLKFVEKTQSPESYYALKIALEKTDGTGKRAVLIIDEAHLLSESDLERIRLLSNYETESRKLIQIVLVGQKELYQTLQKDKLKSLRQRIVINRMLETLDRKETERYIRHRLRVAGREAPLFDRKALGRIWEHSRGAPRIINNICDNALMTGYALESRKIGAPIIQEVITDMAAGFTARKLPIKRSKTPRKLLLPAAAAVLVLIVFLIGYALKDESGPVSIGDEAARSATTQSAAIRSTTAARQAAPAEAPAPQASRDTVNVEITAGRDVTERKAANGIPSAAFLTASAPKATGADRKDGTEPRGADDATPEATPPAPIAASPEADETEGSEPRGADDAPPEATPPAPIAASAEAAETDGTEPRIADDATPEATPPAPIAAAAGTAGKGSTREDGISEDSGIGPMIAEILRKKAGDAGGESADAGAPPPVSDVAADKAVNGGVDGRSGSPNACLAEMAQARYGVGNDFIVDLLRMANPNLGAGARDCTGMQVFFPTLERDDLIREMPDGAFRIHYASFYSADAASAMIRKPALAEQEASVTEAQQGNDRVFRVLAGRYATRAEAESAVARLTFDHLPFLKPQQADRKKMLIEILKGVQ